MGAYVARFKASVREGTRKDMLQLPLSPADGSVVFTLTCARSCRINEARCERHAADDLAHQAAALTALKFRDSKHRSGGLDDAGCTGKDMGARMVLAGLAVLISGLLGLGILLAARWLDAWVWRRQLVAYRLELPRRLTDDQVSGWLTALGSATRQIPAVIEVVAKGQVISHYMAMPRLHAGLLLSQARNMLPGIRIEEAPAYLADESIIRAAGGLRVTSTSHPLDETRAATTSGALLSALQHIGKGNTVRVSWILAGTATPHPARLSELAPDLARFHRLKERSPLLRVCGRISVSGDSPEVARALLYRVYSAMRTLDGPGAALVRRTLPWRVVASRIRSRSIPITTWPAILNTREMAGLLGFPIDGIQTPGMVLGTAPQLPPPPDLPRRGLVLARSNYPDEAERPLALRQVDRLQHLWLLGPTGTGKSTLIANLALQDAAAGYGLIVIDPKSDLCDEVLARLPEERSHDVIALNPAATDRPIGFNILQSARGEQARELVVDDVVRIFAEVWKSSFGPRTADVLRNTLLTLTAARAPDGSAFTLAEVAPLLEDPAFRRTVTAQPAVPETVRSFWAAYESMSAGTRNQTIGPSLNKLRALTTRTSLRLMLGQSKGIDVADVFTKRRILLASLNKGAVGSETAKILGSFLVASMWNAALRRAAIPKEARRPVWAYLDEFQDVLRMGSDVADAFAQARGLGLGLIPANQYIGQLSPAIQAAMGTVRSSIAFQLDSDDARAMERRFAPALTAEDLMGLRAYEVAARLCVDGQTRQPVTGRTLPLGEPTRDAFALTQASRERFGVPRADVETALRSRLATSSTTGAPGRRRGGTS